MDAQFKYTTDTLADFFNWAKYKNKSSQTIWTASNYRSLLVNLFSSFINKQLAFFQSMLWQKYLFYAFK